jgi:hypothetical protein
MFARGVCTQGLQEVHAQETESLSEKVTLYLLAA